MTSENKARLLEYMKEVTAGGWVTAGLDVQYKVVNKVLYFQCSSGKEDWRHNFDFWAKPYKNMKEVFYVHKGFRDMWQSVRDEIAKLEFNVIVGYSQGAALACLAHEDFLYRNGWQPRTVVFGCPRFLWLASKKIRLRFSKVERVQNRWDIVAKVPLIIMGYQHGASKVIENLTGRTKRPKSIKRLVWASNHCPEMYIQRLGGTI